MGHVGSKARSLGKISRDHILSPVFLKAGHNDCLDGIFNVFGNGSCWVKNYHRSQGQILEKCMFVT